MMRNHVIPFREAASRGAAPASAAQPTASTSLLEGLRERLNMPTATLSEAVAAACAAVDSAKAAKKRATARPSAAVAAARAEATRTASVLERWVT